MRYGSLLIRGHRSWNGEKAMSTFICEETTGGLDTRLETTGSRHATIIH